MMRVLLVNDDGPPAPHSPHILGLYERLRKVAGWEVSVVLPSSQKSWGSMAFTLHPPCSAWYYYPLAGNHDGSHPDTSLCWSASRRPVRDGELGEWVLVDGSPTTCANIGLYSLPGILPSSSNTATVEEGGRSTAPQFDLVISGPNFGRNTGTAFSLCSGTIGAALAASLSGVRAISLSYAHFHQISKSVEEAEKKRAAAGKQSTKWGNLPESAPTEVVERAHELSCRLIAKLYDEWESDVGVYTINVPLTYHLLDEGAQKVYWTRTWDSKFGPLFELEEQQQAQQPSDPLAASPGFSSTERRQSYKPSQAPAPSLALRFAPNMASMLQPLREQQSGETDIWAILHGHISIARLNPSYTAVVPPTRSDKSNGTLGSHFKL